MIFSYVENLQVFAFVLSLLNTCGIGGEDTTFLDDE